MQSELETAVRTYVVENFLFGDGSRLTPTQSLLRSGVLDSTGVMELISFLEETWDLRIDDAEVVPSNLDSIASIARFVERKLAGEQVTAR